MMTKTKLITPAFKTLIDEFNNFINVRGYSIKETKAQINGTTPSKESFYGRRATDFLNYLEMEGITNIKNVRRNHIVEYREYLQERYSRKGGFVCNVSINSYINHLHVFFYHLQDTKQIESLPVFPAQLKVNTQDKEVLNQEEIEQLYHVCSSKIDKAILGIGLCGLRKTEIELLNISDIQFSRAILIVRKGKRNKRREVPIPERILNDLKDYLINERPLHLKTQKDGFNEAFLINKRGKRMLGDSLGLHLKALIAKTNNHRLKKKEITLHSLRRTTATLLLDNGAPAEFVRDILGHTSIDMVHLYSKRRKLKQRQINAIKNAFN